MNDNDIIKALVKCGNPSNGCSGCPLLSSAWDEYGKSIAKCRRELICYALDLINRWKAEIERLTFYNENLCAANADILGRHLDFIAEAKSEAIKEFADGLKKEIEFSDTITKVERHIDNLVKEMTEDTK